MQKKALPEIRQSLGTLYIKIEIHAGLNRVPCRSL